MNAGWDRRRDQVRLCIPVGNARVSAIAICDALDMGVGPSPRNVQVLLDINSADRADIPTMSMVSVVLSWAEVEHERHGLTDASWGSKPLHPDARGLTGGIGRPRP